MASLSKYKNKKVVYDGRVFDSQKEMRRYIELQYLERAGQITELECQRRIEIIPKTARFNKLTYICDFTYITSDGRRVYEDIKGYKGGAAYRHFKDKMKMLYYLHGIEVVEL